jgi:SLT domain-containing protein
MYTSVKEKIGNMYTSVKDGIGNIYNSFKNWISNLWDNVFGKFFDWINTGIDKLREFFGLDSKAKNTDTSYADSSGSGTKTGHATGGIFNREHIARFAEGNKAEAVIPLENAGAMQPFVDAVADGITASLMPIVANISGGQNQLQPLYVGTLIADERSLKELNRKMQVIQLQENKRRG